MFRRGSIWRIAAPTALLTFVVYEQWPRPFESYVGPPIDTQGTRFQLLIPRGWAPTTPGAGEVLFRPPDRPGWLPAFVRAWFPPLNPNDNYVMVDVESARLGKDVQDTARRMGSEFHFRHGDLAFRTVPLSPRSSVIVSYMRNNRETLARTKSVILESFRLLPGGPSPQTAALQQGQPATSRSALSAALLKAAERDDRTQIEALLARGADARCRGQNGWTPFMFVALTGDEPAMRMLLHVGADVNGRDSDGSTPIMNASMLGRSNPVRILLSMKADVNLSTRDGDTALSRAADSWDDITEMLLTHGAKVNVKNSYGNTPLIVAVSFGHGPDALTKQFYKRRLRIVRLLLKHGANPNVKNRNGYTAIMAASRQGNIEMVQDLLKSHADVDIRDSKGRTALDFARAKHRDDVVRLLQFAQSKRKTP